ncbi:MAG: acyl-ACP--UDP-N-acetylglucosamine O-acyltransferase [Opitutales bacterium]|nr:acyl-ACP--UDP-N-acetylglucosamine O-acyltransferase [Opitutales bacterium]
MAAEIHSTAIVDPKAELDFGVKIGPYAIVEKGAKIGRDSNIEAHALIKERAIIGQGCRVGHFSVIGGDPQHLSFDPSTPSYVNLGAGVRISEGVTIHRSINENQYTEVGNDCFLMGNSHIAHDCILAENVILANGVLLGGHVEIGKDVFVGGGAALHQFVRVGNGAMIGGMAQVSADVPPQITLAGRNQASGLNLVGLKRRGVPLNHVSELKNLYTQFLCRSGNLKQRATDLLASKTPPQAEIAIGFVRFFLAGSRNFAKSLKQSNNEDPLPPI